MNAGSVQHAGRRKNAISTTNSVEAPKAKAVWGGEREVEHGCRLQDSRLLESFIDLERITGAHILKFGHRKTTLHTLADLGHIRLEMFHRLECTYVRDKASVLRETMVIAEEVETHHHIPSLHF